MARHRRTARRKGVPGSIKLQTNGDEWQTMVLDFATRLSQALESGRGTPEAFMLAGRMMELLDVQDRQGLELACETLFSALEEPPEIVHADTLPTVRFRELYEQFCQELAQ